MTMTIPKLLVVDPLTLVGRELLLLLERQPGSVQEIAYRHTADDDEHQIAELAGQPGLVPPLSEADDLSDCSAVVIASESDSPRIDHLVRFLDNDVATPVVVVGRAGRLSDLTIPAAASAPSWNDLHVRVAHPALVALSTVTSALRHLEPHGGSLGAVDPVSPIGRGAIELLARQASHRLQGGPVGELIDGNVLAFTLVTMSDADISDDAALLFPHLDLSVTRSLAGYFHGHVAHIGLSFYGPLDEQDMIDALYADDRIVLRDPPLSLDDIVETDVVSLTRPRLSLDRKHIACTAMVDGLRVGGAVTALEILHSLLESPS